MTTRELLQVFLGNSDKNERDAKSIVGMDTNIVDMSIGDLSPIIGRKKAEVLVSLFELARRQFKPDKVFSIRKPEDLLPKLEDIRNLKQEHFICVTMNGANELIRYRTITIGLLNSSQVHPREVFADAITDRAASIILAHNHPSGTLEPSKADTLITKQLCESGKLLGIEVLDHIIVTTDGFTSLKDKGYM